MTERHPASPRAALITGAASGIGRCVAMACAKRGWPVVIVDINEDGLRGVANEIREAYAVEVYPLTLNLTDPDAPEKCLAFCEEHVLTIDFLANIAGVFIFDPLLAADERKTELMLDLHIKTVTRMCIRFGEGMKMRRYGYIMNMSSLSAWMPMPGIATYNATKSYIRSLSRALAFELKPWGVSVTAICPGGCNTPLLPLPDRLRKLAVTLGFLMQPEKLAEKAVHATLKRRQQSIPGFINYVLLAFIALMPNWAISLMMKLIPIYKPFLPPKD